MKILLLGEYSGLYKNLKEGLEYYGHDVSLISTGDSWKKIVENNQHFFSTNKNRFIRRVHSIFLQLKNINKFKNFDIVQLISPNIFGGLKIGYNYKMLNIIKNHNNKMFLTVAGNHYYIYRISQNLEYSYFKLLPKNNRYTKKSYIKNNNETINLVDGIIPTTYTYAEAYRNHPKLLNTIPFPINVDKVKYIPQKIENNKLKIFHGLNREQMKGTKYIRAAMEKIKENYPKDVDIIIDGKMPLGKYLKVLEEANIVVDQAYSYGYGMNALYSLAMGKVVLSGNEPECGKEFGRDDIPVINIKPSVEDIYNKLEKLVLNKKCIEEIGYKSRKFVEDFHDYKKVAKQYLETWEKCGDNN